MKERSKLPITRDAAREWIMAVAQTMYAGRKAPRRKHYDARRPDGVPVSDTLCTALGYKLATDSDWAGAWRALVADLTGLEVDATVTMKRGPAITSGEIEETQDTLRPTLAAELDRGLPYSSVRVVGSCEYYLLK